MITNIKQSIHKPRHLAIMTAALVAFSMATGSAFAIDFRYTGDLGPGFWDELTDSAACGRSIEPGARQSPIDITNFVRDKSLRRLDLNTFPTEVALINNGHTVEQEYDHSGSTLFFEGIEYQLLQFHFHTQSEHAVKGDRGVMELHAVFSNGDGKLAVIGLIYDIGDDNDFLEKLIEAGLPEKDGDVVHGDDEVNLADALTSTKKFYTYLGSLTTPPCTESVTWVVLRKNAEMSHDQFKAFNDIMGNNFRPLQARNSREVRRSR